MGRLLIITGLALAAFGGLLIAIEKLGLGMLPGDIVWRRKSFTLHFPIVTCLLVSLVLTLLLNVFLRKR
jgi:hypothetical protein